MNDNHFGAELHMVHKLQGGDRYAVVGLFIQASDFVNNELFSEALAGFDAAADATALACNMTPPVHWWSQGNSSFADAASDETVNVYGMIPPDSTFYHYDGGLTTPPCSEVVEWNVADKPLSVSVAQYNDLSGLILNYLSPDTCEYATIASPSGSTSRPVQLLNNRTVERICPVGYDDDSDSGGEGGDGGSAGGATSGGAGAAAAAFARWAATLSVAAAWAAGTMFAPY
jgi:carbonic anhydrase